MLAVTGRWSKVDHSRAQHVTHRLPWSRDRRLRVADRAIDRGTLESVRECQTLKVRAPAAAAARNDAQVILHGHHRPGRRGPRAARVRASTERRRRFAVARSCVRRRVGACPRRGSTGVPCSAKRPARARAWARHWGAGRVGGRGAAATREPVSRREAPRPSCRPARARNDQRTGTTRLPRVRGPPARD